MGNPLIRIHIPLEMQCILPIIYIWYNYYISILANLQRVDIKGFIGSIVYYLISKVYN